MRARVVAFVAAVALAGGCGPVAYVHQVTLSADDAVDQARAAGAEKYSPYWWTRAVQYLHMAREVAAHADFQGANRFGRLATEAAIEAKKEAEIGAQDPSKLPYRHVDAQSVAPAKDKDVAPAKDEPAPAKDKDVAPAKDEPAPAKEPAK